MNACECLCQGSCCLYVCPWTFYPTKGSVRAVGFLLSKSGFEHGAGQQIFQRRQVDHQLTQVPVNLRVVHKSLDALSSFCTTGVRLVLSGDGFIAFSLQTLNVGCLKCSSVQGMFFKNVLLGPKATNAVSTEPWGRTMTATFVVQQCFFDVLCVNIRHSRASTR